ncbi:hypothetical protein [Kitasatospora viridis]|uniref:Subtilisin inhibitor-like n=1 Tax=Kitasatospora viridis TaxID=281105 RepID=A0A561UG26_9ACTN|nr:hypothetical protein [Kitasatospora viridis]TWF98314.1 hypothetical protein FHX73_112121 [Kitasatospora viridis]
MALRKTLAALATCAALTGAALGGGAPTAAAAEPGASVARYTVTFPDTGKTLIGNATPSPGEVHSVRLAGTSAQQPPGLTCWAGRTDGPTFYESCDGTRYYTFAFCSDGFRYVVGPFGGRGDFEFVCPTGSDAIWGGSID